VGLCPLLPALLGHRASSGLSLALLREASDFFGASRMALVYPKSATFVPGVLKRIGRWFSGTFGSNLCSIVHHPTRVRISGQSRPFAASGRPVSVLGILPGLRGRFGGQGQFGALP
jgi:hypothetical protein